VLLEKTTRGYPCKEAEAMATTIEIPSELKQKAEEAAHARGMSLEAFIHEVLEWVLNESYGLDPLFADDAVYEGETPADLSAKHDQYLYDEVS
jgi:predicted DNA-binding protein